MAILVIILATAAIVLISVSIAYYIKMLKLASKHAKGYFKPYKEIRTSADTSTRIKRDFLVLIKTPEEFKNKDLIRSINIHRTTYWLGFVAVIVALSIPV